MVEEFTALAQKVGTLLQKDNLMLTTVESCTGGWVGAALTSIAGSSTWFERGFITYSNQAKQDLVGVPANILNEHGAVSKEVVLAMAIGGLRNSTADVSLAITGIAGPDGGTEDKPVGTVWFAWAGLNQAAEAACMQFNGNRNSIRKQCVEYSLAHLISML